MADGNAQPEISRRGALRWLVAGGIGAILSKSNHSAVESAGPQTGNERTGQTKPAEPKAARLGEGDVREGQVKTPENWVEVLEKNTESYYVEAAGETRRVRTLEHNPNSETSCANLKRQAQEGKAFMAPSHPAVIAELDFLAEWARQTPEMRQKLLERYALGLFDGLKKIYSPTEQRVIALEVGHMSVPNGETLAKLKADRKAKGLPPLGITTDTGTDAELAGGGHVFEREVAWKVSKMVADLVEKETSWVAVLNSHENGYPIDKMDEPHEGDEFYFMNRDVFPVMEMKWQNLAQKGVPMAQMAVHLDGGENQGRSGGTILLPNFGKYAAESKALGQALSNGLWNQVRQVKFYENKVNNYTNTPEEPYWSLDMWADNVADVIAGSVNKVKGVTNKLFAKLRADYLKTNVK